MKRLLTFIYGLLLIALALSLMNRFTEYQEWYRWIYFILAVLSMVDGFRKLTKATE